MLPAGAANDCVQAPRWSVDSAYGPVTSTRRGFPSGSVPSFFSSTDDRGGGGAHAPSGVLGRLGALVRLGNVRIVEEPERLLECEHASHGVVDSRRVEHVRGRGPRRARSDGAPPISMSRPAA